MDLVRTSSAEERRRITAATQTTLVLEREDQGVAAELAATTALITQLSAPPRGLGPPLVDSPYANPREALRAWCFGFDGGADIFGVPAPPITQLSFGDELAHPITVLSADFDCCVLADQQCALVTATLTVANERVHGDKVKATLKFPLPDGAVVCGFQLQVGDHMLDAMAVDKKKAAEVAYKEKEKGRAVATTEAVQGSVWSTEVFPLPMGVRRTITISFKSDCLALPTAEGGSWALALPLSFKQPVSVVTATIACPELSAPELSVVDNISGRATETLLENGLRIAIASRVSPRPALRIAQCPVTHEHHFSGLIPASIVQQALSVAGSIGASGGGAGTTVSVALMWDVSGSRKQSDDQLLTLVDTITASHARQGHVLSLAVYTFSTELTPLVTPFLPSSPAGVREMVAGNLPLTYDGGTDLSLLNDLSSEFDYAILCTDGIDNFKRRPDMERIPFPTYVALTQGGVHGTDTALLQGIARLSGGACMPLEKSAALVGIASGENDEVVVSCLRLVGLADDALFDERLQTVPDARITQGRWALLESGAARVSGTIPPGVGAPSELVVGISRGDAEAEVSLGAFQVEPAAPAHVGRLLGVSYAVAAKDEAAASQWDPIAAKEAAEELMKRYNVASEHTTLLLLHEAVQFVDNDLPCPVVHPAHSEWQTLAAAKEKRKGADELEKAAEVQRKLDSMISGFAAKFKTLLEYKSSHLETWGKSQADNDRESPRHMRAAVGGRQRSMAAPQRSRGASESAGGFGGGEGRFGGGGGGDFSERRSAAAASFGAASPRAAGMAMPAAPQELGFGSAMSEEMMEMMDEEMACVPRMQMQRMSASATLPQQEQQMRQSIGDDDDADSDDDDRENGIFELPAGFVIDASSDAGLGGRSAAAADATGRSVFLEPINKAIAEGGVDLGYNVLLKFKDTDSGMRDSPSFYLYTAQAFRDAGAPPTLCLKIVSNVLETSLCNAQTCRVVAYFVLSIGMMDTAVLAFENVVTLAPEEPQSQTDLAFARFFRLREKLGKKSGDHPNLSADEVASAVAELQGVVGLLKFVIQKTDIPGRFKEIEWPVLILLSWVVDWAEWRLGVPAVADLWPETELPAVKYRLDAKLDLFIWLGWDTDHTDIDLHVKEPTGEECNYSHNSSRSTGASVSRDFTQGYGPECYVLPHAPAGKYAVKTNYYGSHQDSSTTGSTSCVIWSVRGMGDFEKEEALFTTVRLEDNKGQASCFEAEVGLPQSVVFKDSDGDMIEFQRRKNDAAVWQIAELVNGVQQMFPVTKLGWDSKNKKLTDTTGVMTLPDKQSSAGRWIASWGSGATEDVKDPEEIIADLKAQTRDAGVEWVVGEATLPDVTSRQRRETSTVPVAGKTLTRCRNSNPEAGVGTIELWCETGHTMLAFETLQEGFRCDGCGKACQQGTQMVGCRQCDYDLCGQCFEGATRGWQQEVASGLFPGRAEPEGTAGGVSVLFRGQTLTRTDVAEVARCEPHSGYDAGWVCDGCSGTEAGPVRGPGIVYMYHGTVEPSNPLDINAFDLCERCAANTPEAERRYQMRVDRTAR